MRSIKRIVTICLILLIGAPVQAAEQLNVATSEWVPYVGKQLPNQGLAMDLVNTALKRAGYQPVVTIDVWSRTLQGADVGVYDLIAAAWYSDARAEKFAFSKPYLYNEIKLLRRADLTFDFNSIDDLMGRVVGVVNKYAYGQAFDQAPGIIRVPSQYVFENILKVLNGEVELTLDDERVLKYEIARNIDSDNKQNLAIMPKPVSRNGLYIAVSKQNPKYKEIVAAFDKAIAAMKKDGSYDKILKAHE
jgi:polar amino acid transport system substrate-binding protein